MNRIEKQLTEVMSAVKANDEKRFNQAMADLATIAARGARRDLTTGERIKQIMGETSQAIGYPGMTLNSPGACRMVARQHLGTRNVGRNWAVMVVTPDDVSAWVIKTYSAKGDEIASALLTL